MKQQPANDFRWSGKRARLHGLGAGLFEQDPGNQQAADQHAGNPKQHSDPAAFGALFLAGIQQHDDEDEQHHDGAGVDDDLHRGDELGAQQQIFHCQRSHHHHQRQRAVDGMPLHQQVDRARHADHTEHRK